MIMGDVLFHFVFPLLALMIARIRFRHSLIIVFLLALSSALLDVDHFFGMLPRGTLHNIFVTLLFPLSLYIIALASEKKGMYYKNICLALLLVLFSHPMIDIFTGGAGVMLLYPISDQEFFFNTLRFGVPLPNGLTGYIISSNGIGLSIYTAMILTVIFVEDFNKRMMKFRKPDKALLKTLKFEQKKIKREL